MNYIPGIFQFLADPLVLEEGRHFSFFEREKKNQISIRDNNKNADMQRSQTRVD